MAVKIGTAGIPATSDGNTFSGIDRIRELGLDIIEIQFVRGMYLNERDAKRTGIYAKKTNVMLTCHAPYYINLASQDKMIQEKSKKTIITAAKIANLMGAGIVTVHPGYYSQRDKKEAYNLIEQNLFEITSGYEGDAKIGLETCGRQKSFGRIDEIAQLCSNNKKLCPVIDFGHIHALTNGGLKSKDDFIKILGTFPDFKKIHIHMSCMIYSKGNEKSHAPLMALEPDFRLLADVIKQDKGRDYTVICESPLLESDACLFKKWLETIEKV